jgi:peptide methionine sulfoxide reductase MsrA
MDKINGVVLTVVGYQGKVSKPAYEAHSYEKIIEIINGTWRIDHVTDITNVEIY